MNDENVASITLNLTEGELESIKQDAAELGMEVDQYVRAAVIFDDAFRQRPDEPAVVFVEA